MIDAYLLSAVNLSNVAKRHCRIGRVLLKTKLYQGFYLVPPDIEDLPIPGALPHVRTISTSGSPVPPWHNVGKSYV